MSEVILSKTKVNVKNITKHTLNLANGAIKAGAEGVATIAELQCLSKHIVEAGGEVPKTAAEKKAEARAKSLAATKAKAEAKPKATKVG